MRILPIYEENIAGIKVKLLDCVEVEEGDAPVVSWTCVPDSGGLAKTLAMWRLLQPYKLSSAELNMIRLVTGLSPIRLFELTDIPTVMITDWDDLELPVRDIVEKLIRHTLCGYLKDAVWGLTYEPSMVSTMRIIDQTKLFKTSIPVLQRVYLRCGGITQRVWTVFYVETEKESV
jgi:hypothetical protein